MFYLFYHHLHIAALWANNEDFIERAERRNLAGEKAARFSSSNPRDLPPHIKGKNRQNVISAIIQPYFPMFLFLSE